jgi:hypothetical protein
MSVKNVPGVPRPPAANTLRAKPDKCKPSTEKLALRRLVFAVKKAQQYTAISILKFNHLW